MLGMAQASSDLILGVIRKKIPDSGALWNVRYHCVKGGIREPAYGNRWQSKYGDATWQI